MMRRIMGAIVLAAIGATAAPANCVLNKVVTFKVTMNDSQPEVTAKINGRPTPFIIDSGAWYSLISPGAAAEAGLTQIDRESDMEMSGIGGRVAIGSTKVKKFTIADVDIPGLTFIVGGSEVGATGLLGQNFLHFGDVEYDLPHGEVSLFKPKDCTGKIGLAYWIKDGQPFSMLPLSESSERLAHTKADILINGQHVRAMFDTGAGTSLLSLRAAARLGIKPDSPGVVRAGHTRGVGSRMVQQWIVPINEIQLDGETIRKNRLMMADMSDADVDMLIGIDFFLSHRVYVANGQRRMYFSYTGGSVFRVDADKTVRAVDGQGRALELKDNSAEPTDAEGYSRRGMAALAKARRDAALADLDKAVGLAPKDIRFLLQRATIHAQMGRPALAEADLAKAIALEPGNAEASFARATFYAETGQAKRAMADIEATSRHIEKASDKRYALSDMLMDADQPEKAIVELDQWISLHPVDSRMGLALNRRCWARALLGRDLAKALTDCTAALRTIPHKALALDSRGLVHLRMGDAAGAVKDYDAALALNPKISWSLYGRGLAKLKLGLKADGEEDIAAAKAAQADIAEEAKRWGVAP